MVIDAYCFGFSLIDVTVSFQLAPSPLAAVLGCTVEISRVANI